MFSGQDCDEPRCTKSATQQCPTCSDHFCDKHMAIHRTRCGIPDEHPEIPEMMA